MSWTSHALRGGDAAPVDTADAGGSPLERWLRELERLDVVLAAQSRYLDAVEHGQEAAPPAPFVGALDLPEIPSVLTPYARELVARNEAVTRRAESLVAQLRPRLHRPTHVAAAPTRGERFEHQA